MKDDISGPSFFPLEGVKGVLVSWRNYCSWFQLLLPVQAVDIFALISSVALVFVASRVILLAVLQRISRRTCKPKEYIFFNTQLGYYAICLLVGNMITDVSGLIGLQWLLDRGITEGFCFTGFQTS